MLEKTFAQYTLEKTGKKSPTPSFNEAFLAYLDWLSNKKVQTITAFDLVVQLVVIHNYVNDTHFELFKPAEPTGLWERVKNFLRSIAPGLFNWLLGQAEKVEIRHADIESKVTDWFGSLQSYLFQSFESNQKNILVKAADELSSRWDHFWTNVGRLIDGIEAVEYIENQPPKPPALSSLLQAAHKDDKKYCGRVTGLITMSYNATTRPVQNEKLKIGDIKSSLSLK